MRNKLSKIIKPLAAIIFTAALCFSVCGCGSDKYSATFVYSQFASQLDSDADEAFLFFTDPHLMEKENVIERDYVKGKLKYIKGFYERLPLDFIVCGGDWYDGEAEADVAKEKLKFAADYMYDNFDRYYPVVGNHDTNYQGEYYLGADRLTTDEIAQSACYEQGKTYYDFNGRNTHFYVFDSGSDWDNWKMTEEWIEQIEWFAEKVKEDEGNVAIIVHMYYFLGERVGTLSKELVKICQAFNTRTTYEFKEKNYDYSECQGKVRFILAGHMHEDFTTIAENTINLPVIGTCNLLKGGKVNFDLVNVNYSEGTIKLIRVGNGENRVVALAD